MTRPESQDQISALDARDDLLFIVDRWPALTAKLQPGGSASLSGRVTSTSTKPLPIDVHVSDLMFEIEEKVARFYGHILLDEVPVKHGCRGACHGSPEHNCGGHYCASDRIEPNVWPDACPLADRPITTSAMPGLLEEVARRFGHFTEDPMLALGFADDAHDYRERVRKTLERPAPPMYVGPCQARGEDGAGCVGELYIGEGKAAGKCRCCGTAFTLAEQREWLDGEMESRLMTATEIGRALKILGTPVLVDTIHKWVARGRLIEVVEGEGLYRLAEAKALAEKPINRRAAA